MQQPTDSVAVLGKIERVELSEPPKSVLWT